MYPILSELVLLPTIDSYICLLFYRTVFIGICVTRHNNYNSKNYKKINKNYLTIIIFYF